MDPIQPIVPQPPNIPPIAPAPRMARVEPDGGGKAGADGGGQRRRRRGAAPPDEPDPGDQSARFDEDGGHPHIDVTA